MQKPILFNSIIPLALKKFVKERGGEENGMCENACLKISYESAELEKAKVKGKVHLITMRSLRHIQRRH